MFLTIHDCISVRRGDVLSAWCGIRPLVSDPNKSDTQSLARNHIIEVSQDKLITIAGKVNPSFSNLELSFLCEGMFSLNFNLA